MAGLYKSTYILAVTLYKDQLQTNKKKKTQLTSQLHKHIQKLQTLKTVGNEM